MHRRLKSFLAAGLAVVLGLSSSPASAASEPVIVPLGQVPGVTRTSHEPGSTHASNEPLQLTLRHGVSAILTRSIEVWVAGENMTASALIRTNILGATVELPLELERSKTFLYWVVFQTAAAPGLPYVVKAAFSTDIRGPGDFLVEAEDYDFEGGKTLSEASLPTYRGLGFKGRRGVAGVDYSLGTNAVPLETSYRIDEEPSVPMLFGQDLERSGFRVNGSWLVNARAGSWFQYTRKFPSALYCIYAALSHGNDRFGDLEGDLMWGGSAGGAPGPVIGTFIDYGSGAWGENRLVPLIDAVDFTPITLPLSGLRTVRYRFSSGAADYLLFVPLPGVTLLGVELRDQQIQIEWAGRGRIWSAPDPSGPYEALDEALESPVRIPVSGARRFFQIRPLVPVSR